MLSIQIDSGLLYFVGLTTMAETSKLEEQYGIVGVTVLLLCVLVAVPIFIYFGIQKDKYDIDKYNKTNSEENKERDNKIGKISGIIMLIATMIFFATGIIYNIWNINWIVFPLGGMLCSIVATILGKE